MQGFEVIGSGVSFPLDHLQPLKHFFCLSSLKHIFRTTLNDFSVMQKDLIYCTRFPYSFIYAQY